MDFLVMIKDNISAEELSFGETIRELRYYTEGFINIPLLTMSMAESIIETIISIIILTCCTPVPSTQWQEIPVQDRFDQRIPAVTGCSRGCAQSSVCDSRWTI